MTNYPMTTLAVSDPWQPYAAKPNPVPEPGAYGVVLLMAAILVIGLERWRRAYPKK